MISSTIYRSFLLLYSLIPPHRDDIDIGGLILDTVDFNRNDLVAVVAGFILSFSQQRAIRVVDLDILDPVKIFRRIQSASEQQPVQSP
jgi:hypothetical protein|nr:MAG TPA: hypothetical protein [Caudoviricetes sp.]